MCGALARCRMMATALLWVRRRFTEVSGRAPASPDRENAARTLQATGALRSYRRHGGGACVGCSPGWFMVPDGSASPLPDENDRQTSTAAHPCCSERAWR